MFRHNGIVLAWSRLAGCLLLTLAATGSDAAKSPRACAIKAANGTGETEKSAKFQAYEGILPATDWGAWASFMANGITPGYKVAPVKYSCVKNSGLGFSCRGRTKICKV